MHAIIDAAIDRSRTILMLLALILIMGFSTYLTIPKESDPDVPIPIIYVLVRYDGIAPQDAERLLVRPLEKELRSIEGVKEMRSTAAEGYGNVLLEFEAGFDSAKALDDVRAKVDFAKRDLPAEADEPEVHEVNVALFPVLVVNLFGDLPERQLIRIGRDLRDNLQSLPGVLEVTIGGDREDLLEVVIDPVKLEAYSISQQDLINTVTRNNQLVPAGAMDTGAGRFSLKVPGLVEGPDDVLNLPVKVSGDAVVTLRDVTVAQRTFKDATSYARTDGRNAIALEIKKRIGVNVIDTIEDVKRVVAEDGEAWPAELQVAFTQDSSTQIQTMLGDLQNNVISAVLLVMIVVVAALGLRSALLVGMAIPTSFLIGILTLSMAGLTVNIVVLFALILVVGMLVDGAIIVVEFADRRMAEGATPRMAYGEAAKRMSWPVIASTATTLAAFAPLMFWPGVVGEFMIYLPITLMATLTGSLLVALIFLPTMGSLIGRPAAGPTGNLIAAGEQGDLDALRGLTAAYANVLRWATRHAWLVAVGTLGILVGVWAWYATHGSGIEFFPDVEPEQALVYVHARGNYSTAEKDVLVRQVEARILPLTDFKSVYARTGDPPTGQDVSPDVIGTIQLEFKEWDQRRPSDVVLEDIRLRTADLAGIYVEPREPDVGPPTGKDVQLQFASRIPELLDPIVDRARAYMETVDGLVDLEDSRPPPGIDWELTVDRELAGRFGADIASIGAMVQLVTNGIMVGEYRPYDADQEVEIRVRLPRDSRTFDQLDQLRVVTSMGSVPLSNFVERRAIPKRGKIERVDSRRVITIRANTMPGVLPDTKVREIGAWLQQQEMDPRVTWSFRGADEEQQKAQAFLSQAFLVALFAIAIILVTQFNSFYHAFLVLTAVIMSTIGVIIGLIVTGQTFGIVMTGIGIIALAGVVVNNNIVLIDTYRQLCRRGMEPLEAVIRTGVQRLRPVMLTTITTVVGLMPMVLQMNIDFVSRTVTTGAPSTQWWVQLATAVASGLIFATLLTLIFTPAMLALGARISGWQERRRNARRQGQEVPAPAE